MRELIPQSRLITAALMAGLAALLIYGFIAHDPLTGVILGVIVVFFAAPALLVFFLNRRAQHHDREQSDR